MTTLSLAKPRPRPLISWRVRKLLIGYSYLVPAALCMLATVVVPIILAIKMSLYADVLYKPADYRFIGLGNYVRLVQDPVFWLTLWNSVVWVFGSVILQFVFGFCRRTAAAAGLQGARFGAHAHFAALDHPGSRGGLDLAVALSTELWRHQ